MIKLTRIIQISLLSVVLASIASAADPTSTATPSQTQTPTDLEKEMKNIGKNAKALKLSVADPAKQTEALGEIGQMIKSAEAAKTMTPKKAADIAEAERPQFITEYQQQIEGLIEQFKKIEADLTAGKTADAKADFAKINEIKRNGHEKFTSKE